MFDIYPVNPELERVRAYSVQKKISFLRTHFEKIENIFNQELDALSRECVLEMERTQGDDDDGSYDYRASEAMREIEYVFLRMHRYSAILAIYSYLETSMMVLCKDAKESLEISICVNDLRGEGIFACKKYLELLAGVDFNKINGTWSNLVVLNKVRNCIVHADGDANKARRDDLLNIIGSNRGLSFVEKSLIMVSSDFIFDAIDDVENILVYLAETERPKRVSASF
ncbi:hypothetical protein [Uliginosibacterium sp. TH139]|uniref:hypothetical protein n=1 Tax=Uliginosibacterium sp. TH139 TaxID=2067453 RepID=UPI000C7C5AAE|nr:hypothetical protein [Uliginosibacterium sp. TH139]PLK49422.1 hypothetical protein C0V76_09555 [Uliginosibacterium sp. TH139]